MTFDRFITGLLVVAIIMSIVAFGHDIYTDGWLDGHRECREAIDD